MTNYINLTVQVFKNAINADAVHLFEVDSGKNRMRLLESVSEIPNNEILGECPVASGILAAIFKENDVFILNNLSGRGWNVPYYGKKASLSAFLAAPFSVSGVHRRASFLFCLEKIDGDFSVGDRTAARSVVSMLSDLLVFSGERDVLTREVMILRNAVNAALDIHMQRDETEILSSLHKGIDEIVKPRAIISSVYDEKSEEFKVASVSGIAGQLKEKTFKPGEGLVGLAVRYNTVLPEKMLFKNEMNPLLGKDCQVEIREDEPLVVIPMEYESVVAGAVAVIGREPFSKDILMPLRVIVNAASSSIQLDNEFRNVVFHAVTDELTGLYNRRNLFSRLREIINLSRRHARDLSVVMADLDHFKSVNDTYGHAVGDLVLKAVAEIIRMNLRDYDIPARYGGEEFCLLLPETGIEGAAKLADRIRDHVSRLNVPAGRETLSLTMSMGIAHFPTHGKTA
ncbi:MAG: GGDEF domain-containing protein, partial [Deltaproteobacteria bacterium]|nr:GGDEF domain-containing protein [Deltaproteobacteria bacterium]